MVGAVEAWSRPGLRWPSRIKAGQALSEACVRSSVPLSGTPPRAPRQCWGLGLMGISESADCEAGHALVRPWSGSSYHLWHWQHPHRQRTDPRSHTGPSAGRGRFRLGSGPSHPGSAKGASVPIHCWLVACAPPWPGSGQRPSTQRKGAGTLVPLAGEGIDHGDDLTLPKLPRRMAPRLRMPNQVSIWFIQEAEVGVKWGR